MNLCAWLALTGWFFISSESLATRLIHDPGRTVETSYDALNRPETIAEGGRLTTYGYDRAGRAVILVLGNGQVTENEYDLAGRLKHRTLYSSLENRTPTGIQAKFDWTYNALGNVMTQEESWPGALGGNGVKTTTLSYDDASRLTGEIIDLPTGSDTSTVYAYDDANNRESKTVTGGSGAGHWDYHYNSANQLTAWEKREMPAGTILRQATLTYDDAGNRDSLTITGGAASTALAPAEAATGTTTYQWDAQDRLVAVTTPDGGEHQYAYDYRTRRIATQETPASGPAKNRAVVFSGGVSLAEYEGSTPVTVTSSLQPAVHYLRGPDMGGGVGGMLYSQRGTTLKYSLSNGRGDIVAQSNQTRAITWQASYEAYSRRTQETGVNEDRQRANSKEEDPTGLLNEGFRYRDLETGVWLSRDPAGFVDGPNLYAYVKQNPWTSFDPKGLYAGRVVGAAARETIKRQAKTMVKDAVKDAFKDALYDKALGEYGGVLGPAAEAKINKALKKLDRKGKWTEWLDPTGIYSAKKDFDHMNKVVDEVFSEVQDLVNSARKTAEKSKGMAKKMHPLDADAKPYPDITGKEYKGEMKPETLVNDHKKARALGGEDASHNIDKETWETNSRKAGFEGNIAKDRQKMIDAGMDPADVDKALSPEMKWIQNDIHPVPVAPAKLNPLPQQ